MLNMQADTGLAVLKGLRPLIGALSPSHLEHVYMPRARAVADSANALQFILGWCMFACGSVCRSRVSM